MPETEIQEAISLEARVVRAAAALYRVTDILSDEEPIKWSLRKDAVELTQAIEKNFRNNNNVQQSSLEQAEELCYALRTKFSIMQGGGFISRINFEVLQKEYTAIADIIKDKRTQMSFMYYRNLLDIPIGQELFQKDIKDTEKTLPPISEAPKKDLKKHTDDIYPIRKKNDIPPSSTVERHEKIKKILQGRGWLGMSEITDIYGSPIGTKMLQRDLNILAESGAVRVQGERRWRKYQA